MNSEDSKYFSRLHIQSQLNPFYIAIPYTSRIHYQVFVPLASSSPI